MSENTKAILLLVASLGAGGREAGARALTLGEYNRLAQCLHARGSEPADLLSSEQTENLVDCLTSVDAARVKALLQRGFALGRVLQEWQSHSIWVVSRADHLYPSRLKKRLREKAPPLLFGCGDFRALESGGLAVVGSRDATDELLEYAYDAGSLAAGAGKTLVSGGARGIDRAAMEGALAGGGQVCGVLADSLIKATLIRDNRKFILGEQLTLVSPFEPSSRFNVGNAMQRNKVVYALSDVYLVVNSDIGKGGTWSGAVEQLDRYKTGPLFVRSTGAESPGLDALLGKGARHWPNPKEPDALRSLFESQDENLSSREHSWHTPAIDYSMGAAKDPYAKTVDGEVNTRGSLTSAANEVADDTDGRSELPPADALYAAANEIIQGILSLPKREVEVAEALGVSSPVAREWLSRMVEEGLLDKRGRPVAYVVRQRRLF